MRTSNRLVPVVLLTVVLVSLGIYFRGFLLENFITPVSLVIWLFWRILLSFDQNIFWILLIFAAIFFAIYRLLQKPFPPVPEKPRESNATLDSLRYWRSSILLTLEDRDSPNNLLKRDLSRMLTLLYALNRPGAANYEVYSDLKSGAIPLPEPVHAFLFPPEPETARRSLLRWVRSVIHAPGKWLRRWSGREEREYRRAVEEVIAYLESLMET
ncbi:MAG TPA: hypothetical protein VF813_06650 [Anaerolineaceae bacterium]